MADRYGLYGLIPSQHEVNEAPMTYEQQNVGDSGGTLIYETDDPAEARALYAAGGFERDGVWHVVTRVEDRLKQRPAPLRSVPSKRDYDQR